ncbi:hypothetical protein [Alcanivorax sp.]|uniref:hypothetical protein n=1 Tax=Alcanivorax sp. TaxID=1872427 RepID=UPI000C68ACE8|nr:hypothetical protein [Alcanivorax sp.]MBQ26088.1 hypothetical protein [Alcanivorax sp.]|tara:strand:+ start:482 stop:1087 length:606 start_codon:yes stop_codon:yes gene_type:complete
MKESSLFESYKRDYFFELEMRDKLLQRFQLFMVIATALATVLGYLIINRSNYDFAIAPALTFFFFIILSSSSLVLSFYFFHKGVTGQEYEYLPSPGNIENYFRELREYADNNGFDDDYVISEIREFYYQSYLSGAETNSNLNAERSQFAHRALHNLFGAAIFAGLAFFVLTIFGEPVEKSQKNIIYKETICLYEKNHTKEQ